MNNYAPLRCLQTPATASPSSLLLKTLAFHHPCSQVRYVRTRALPTRNPSDPKTPPFSPELKAAAKKIKLNSVSFKVGSTVTNPFEKGYKVIGFEKARKAAEAADREKYKEEAAKAAAEQLRAYKERERERRARYEKSTEQIRNGTVFQGPPPGEPSKPNIKFREAPTGGPDIDGGSAYRMMQEEHLRNNPDWNGDEDELRRKLEEEDPWKIEDEETVKLFAEWTNSDGSQNYVKALKDTVKEGFRNAHGPTRQFQALVQNVNRHHPDYYKCYHDGRGEVDFNRVVADCKKEMHEEENKKFQKEAHLNKLDTIRESAKAAECRVASD